MIVLVCIVDALVLYYKSLLQADMLVLKNLYCFFLFDVYVYVRFVLQVSFMCCVVEVLFDVVLFYAVLSRLQVSFTC